jgi:hypothetical protein
MTNQYQLTNVEAQRIMAVLDELTADLLSAPAHPPGFIRARPASESVAGRGLAISPHVGGGRGRGGRGRGGIRVQARVGA